MQLKNPELFIGPNKYVLAKMDMLQYCFTDNNHFSFLKGSLGPKLHQRFSHIFVKFLEKESSTKFCGALIMFQFMELKKLKSR